MHTEILSEKQLELLNSIAQYKRSFYLVGGTAIALYLGHRRSIDFDLFTYTRLNKSRIKAKLAQIPYKKHIIFDDVDQLHYNINEVKVTFFNFPYPVEHPVKWENIISMPSLLSLAAMKAFALGRRSKWKDYVDLYFLITRFFSIKEIASEAEKIFTSQFSEKLFREQLAFHKDINYSEEVEYVIPNPPTPDEIRNELIEKATDIF
jgi:hypothetical protein